MRCSVFEKAKTLDELNKAAIQCSKSVIKKESVQKYIINKASRNERLKEDIEKGRYKLMPYHEFVITEPKKRDIHATSFRDRVWQRSLCNNGVRADLTRSFIYDNGACQKHKGTDFAIERVICFLQREFRKSEGKKIYYIHLDVKGFFPSTPHSELKKMLGH